jgi:CheY-like chemotaxis protein
MLDISQAEQYPGASPGLHVRLTVTDTGTGIAPEHLSSVFEPFFTTKEAGKGTGLGLATVYGIVKQHGGWITVASEINRGTTFRIYFPAVASVLPKNKGVRAKSMLPHGTETILVVEDEFAVRLVVDNMLRRCGYRVLQAESGVAALKTWRERKERIDLLLTDLILPDGITGADLGLQLQTADPGLKIIYTSGYASESVSKRLKLVDGVNFLQKPYSPQKLAGLLRKALDQTQ